MTPALLLATVLAARPAAAGPLTLEAAYAAAAARSETVGREDELALQADERARQAAGAPLPAVTGAASYLWQDAGGAGGSLRSSVAPTTQPLAKLTVSQPLFRGLREFAALRGARDLAAAQRLSAAHARVQLYADLAGAFYAVVALDRETAALADEVQALGERAATLQERERVGRSRTSEVLAAQAAQAAQEAALAQARGAAGAARAALALLTGLDAATPLSDAEPDPAVPAEPAAYLAGIEARPDVGAAALRERAAAEGAAAARGARWPSLDLVGNYYLKRAGLLEDVRWDAQLALTVPLFTGGLTGSRVREADSVRRAAGLELARARRQAEQEIRTAFERARGDASAADALGRAAALAARSEAEQAREYKLGLTTNLDVLTALTTRLDTQRALDRARVQLKSDMIRLEAAAARRPAAAPKGADHP